MTNRSSSPSRVRAALTAVVLICATALPGAPGGASRPAASTAYAAGSPSWRVPILMYHMVDTALPSHDLITVHLTVMAPAFEAQLKLLRSAGYRPLSLEDVWAGLDGRTPPARGIVLTFDDGYLDNYTVAFPILEKYGWTGTFFVVTSTIGTKGHMTAAQLYEMARAGMSIESHGQHHIDFSALPIGVARTELANSKRIIAGWSGKPVDFFAYPAGRFTPALGRLLGDLGYHGAVTEVPGYANGASRAFALERVRVDHDDSLGSFARKLGITAPP